METMTGIDESQAQSGTTVKKRRNLFSRSFMMESQSGFCVGLAAIFAKRARMFDANIFVSKKGGSFVNGKNIIELLTLGILHGDELVVTADGPDAADAISEIEYLFTP
jgi:phosphotransferase system HPr (HPr) family protein